MCTHLIEFCDKYHNFKLILTKLFSRASIFSKPNFEILLKSKGIREHVIEILEGGKEAFKERENKYASELSSSI